MLFPVVIVDCTLIFIHGCTWQLRGKTTSPEQHSGVYQPSNSPGDSVLRTPTCMSTYKPIAAQRDEVIEI